MTKITKTQQIEELLTSLNEFKRINRKLLEENTDLKVENSKLKAKLEMYQAFDETEGKKRWL